MIYKKAEMEYMWTRYECEKCHDSVYYFESIYDWDPHLFCDICGGDLDDEYFDSEDYVPVIVEEEEKDEDRTDG